MSNAFEVTFLGTNGSCSFNNGNRAKYGTNTLCIAVKAGAETLIFDAGSGLCGFAGLRDYQQDHIRLFLSHYHIDHVNGLLFFSSFFYPSRKIDLYGIGNGASDFLSTVNGYLSPPLHPVGLAEFKASLQFFPVSSGAVFPLSDGVTVRCHALSHPGGSIGYRVEYGGKSLCYCTDIEFADHQNDRDLEAFTRDTDLLIVDSFFDDGKSIPTWGHSSPNECAEWAKRVNAKKLALFHYGFTATDADIDALEEKARKVFPQTFASADYMRVEI